MIQDRNLQRFVWIPLILVLVSAVYLPALNNEFLSWDDDIFITNNPDVQNLSLNNIKTVFTSTYNNIYIPLTCVTWMLEFHLFGKNPFPFILHNILLHLVNTILVFFLIQRLAENRRIALLGVIIFGLHPIHVESVVWITERKDVLYAAFYLISILCFLTFWERHDHNTGKNSGRWLYLLSMLSFILAISAKGQAVTLALIVMLIIYVRGNRLFTKRNVAIWTPYVLLAAGSGLLTAKIMGLLDQSVMQLYPTSMFHKIIFASYSLAHYSLRTVFPFMLSPIYPQFYGSLPVSYYFYLLSFPVFFYLLYRFRKQRIVFVSLMFYLLNVLPLLDITSTGKVIAADRFSYVPGIGIILLIAWIFERMIRQRFTYAVTSCFVLYCMYLGMYTFRYSQKWQSSETLFQYSLKYYPESPVALTNLSELKLEAGNAKSGLRYANAALSVFPGYQDAYVNRSRAKISLGDISGALADGNTAIKINDNSSKAFNNRGNIFVMMKQERRAESDFKKAIDLNPENFETYASLGILKAGQGKNAEAVKYLTQAIRLNPVNAELYNTRGTIYMKLNQLNSAIDDFNRALEYRPGFLKAFFNRGLVYYRQGKADLARTDLLRVKNSGVKLPEDLNIFLD